MKITVDIPDADVLVLKNDLLDINDWVQKAVKGKVANCRTRMVQEWLPKLMADPAVDTIPADEDAMLALVVARPDYTDRVARDAAQGA
ncbi:hypothetical protein LCGC14_3003840 [marine sediment metagenome]|uniref:Uncharacterized protein n=1 Tax=marine sediment metagenome TaxID=412755 RepID=A0A0F8X0Q4_9ZZZZ